MPHIAVIGSFPSEFLTHLKTAEYTFDVHESFSKFPQDNNNVPDAVAIHGSNTGLESTEAMNLLKSNIILLLFSPPIELLQSLKAATTTPFDLPALTLTDGVPLIIYRPQNADHYHFVPGFNLNPSEDGTSKATYSENLEYSVKLISESISHAKEGITPLATTISLEPPLGTRYYFTTETPISGTYGSGSLTWSINWRVNMYCYATNHIPDANFTSGGGKVYVVLTHSGTWTGPSVISSSSPELSLQTSDSERLLGPESQSPSRGIDQGNNNYQFNASWKQNLNLFQGGGSSPQPFVFPAEYTATYNIPYIDQVSSDNGEKFTFRYEWRYPSTKIASEDTAQSLGTTTTIYGVSIFTSSKLGNANIVCTALVGDATAGLVVTPLDLNFSSVAK